VQAIEAALSIIHDEIERSVWTNANVADPAQVLPKPALFLNGAFLPQISTITIDRQARNIDRSSSKPEARPRATAATNGAWALVPCFSVLPEPLPGYCGRGDHRPTVVAPSDNQIELIATQRAMLGRPQSVPCVERQSLRIAVPVAPDFGPCPGDGPEWIVVRNRTIGPNANNLAGIIGEVLRV
jgi:hypothetical protein